MKLSGPNPQPSFSLSLTLASNPVTPPRNTQSVYLTVFHHNPLQKRVLSIKRTPREKGRGIRVHALVCVRVFVFMFANSACVHVLTFGMGNVLVCSNHKPDLPVHLHVGATCFKVGFI